MSGPLQFQAFDSDIFGFPFFRITDPGHRSLPAALHRVAARGRFAVDAKVDAADRRRIVRLERLQLRRVCTQITLVKARIEPRAGGSGSRILLSDGLKLDARTIVAHANGFTFGRFFQDSRLPRAAVRRHMASWIANSLSGRFRVATCDRNFCTFGSSADELTIDLLSCLDARQGIATRLLQALDTAAAEAGIDRIRVTTEAENVAALRLYLSCGYVPVHSTVCLHRVGMADTTDLGDTA